MHITAILNNDAGLRRLLDAIAETFVLRLAAAYETYLARGGNEFSAEVWYTLDIDSSQPVIGLIVALDEPVYGFGSYVSRLAAGLAEHYEWSVDFKPAVRLQIDLDRDVMKARGWRSLTFPPPLDEPLFSTAPPDTGYQPELTGVGQRT